MESIKRMEPIWLALVVVGALNWLLVGLFEWDLVTEIFGTGTGTDVIYVIVGLRGSCAVPRAVPAPPPQPPPPAPAGSVSTRASAGGCTPGPDPSRHRFAT